MKSVPRITVLGSNMIDLIANIHRMPKKGETVEAPGFDLGFGGKGANQAVAAALLGADVTMVTKVGDDIFGREVKKNFESFGIDTSLVEAVKGASNGVAPIFVDEDGNNSILIIKGANAFFSRSDVDRAEKKIKQSDLVLLQLEIPLDTVYYAIDTCAKHDVSVLMNPAPGARLDFAHGKKVAFFVPNETELEIITGHPVSSIDEVKSAASWVIDKGVRTVVVTLGEKGALLSTKQTVKFIPAVSVEAKDTTGAGDAFIGSFAYYYIKTGKLVEAISYANHYAAFSTLRSGTQKSFYTKEEFEREDKIIEKD